MREMAQRVPILRKALVRGERIFYSQKPKPDPRWLREKVEFTYSE